MRKYNLEQMKKHFTNIYELGFSDFVYDEVIHRLGCHITSPNYCLLEFSFGSCETLEEAKSIALLYTAHWDDEIYHIPTLLKELKNIMESNLDSINEAEKQFK